VIYFLGSEASNLFGHSHIQQSFWCASRRPLRIALSSTASWSNDQVKCASAFCPTISSSMMVTRVLRPQDYQSRKKNAAWLTTCFRYGMIAVFHRHRQKEHGRSRSPRVPTCLGKYHHSGGMNLHQKQGVKEGYQCRLSQPSRTSVSTASFAEQVIPVTRA